MSIESLIRAAENGQADAQLQLAIQWMTGQGVARQDAEEGRRWLGRAADSGHPVAARYLGVIYLRGMDIPPDYEKATRLLEKGANASDGEAAFILSCFLGGSRDQWHDLTKSKSWLEKAAMSGHPRAMTHLAYWLDGNVDGQSDPKEAARWMLRAADAGDGGAFLALAEWAEHGRYLARDSSLAASLAHESARLGWDVAAEYATSIAGSATGPVKLPKAEEFSPVSLNALPSPELEMLTWEPRVVRVRRLLTVFECGEIVAAAREHIMPSFIVDADGSLGTNDIRTSHEVRLRPGLRNVVVRQVEQRMSSWSHFPLEHGEYPLVLRYENQQSFEQHYDYFIPERFSMGEGPLELGGQRVATQLVYLNEAFSGGQTRFDNAGIVVEPERGMCLLFHNVKPDHNVDPLTRHTGVAVNQGVKWLLSRWIRELPFDQPAKNHPRDRYLPAE